MNLQGHIVVVTGASRGLGKALCQALETEGATVIGCASRKSASCDYAVDVRKPAAVKAFIQSVRKRHGRIDVLINNAGWIGSSKPLEKVSLAEYTRTMDTNVQGVFHVLREILPVMKKQNSGVIVNIGSRGATKPHSHLALYCASKAAVLSLTQSVAKGLVDEGSHVRCFSFSPGGIGTDMRRKIFGAADSKAQHSPEFVAELLVSCLRKTPAVAPGADVQVARDGTLQTTQMA